MVVTENKANEITLKKLAEKTPEHINHLLDALKLLMFENELLKKIASRYSHDLRSPVTNIDMLLQLYEKAGNSPDKDLYISKMVKSVQRLQEGFEQLSAERKNLLSDPQKIELVNLDEVIGGLKERLPKSLTLTTDFTIGKQVMGNLKTIEDSLFLLLEPFAENNNTYAIEIATEKSWNDIILTVKYPEFLDLGKQKEEINTSNSNTVWGWNYYFAVLFLRTVGAHIILNENPQKSTVQISFTQ